MILDGVAAVFGHGSDLTQADDSIWRNIKSLFLRR
jgi:hypothetical protein